MKFKFANGHSLQLWESEFTNLVISEGEISYTRANGQNARIVVPKCWLDNNFTEKGPKTDDSREDNHETASQSSQTSQSTVYSNQLLSLRSLQDLTTPPGKGEFEILKRQISILQSQFSLFRSEIKREKTSEIDNIKADFLKHSKENESKIGELRRELSSYSNQLHSLQDLTTPAIKGDFETLKGQIRDFQGQLSNFGKEIKSRRIAPEISHLRAEILKHSKENASKVEELRREFENERTEMMNWKDGIEAFLFNEGEDSPSPEPYRGQYGYKGYRKGRRRHK